MYYIFLKPLSYISFALVTTQKVEVTIKISAVNVTKSALLKKSLMENLIFLLGSLVNKNSKSAKLY